VNLGRSCPAAIRNRYGAVENDETARIEKEHLVLPQHKNNVRLVECVGFEKVMKIQRSVFTNEILCYLVDKLKYNQTNIKMSNCCILFKM
jgi:hypothetical protein